MKVRALFVVWLYILSYSGFVCEGVKYYFMQWIVLMFIFRTDSMACFLNLIVYR